MTYSFPLLPIVTSEEDARDVAIAWQSWQSEQSLSMSEMAEWQAYFVGLVEKYPDLRDEFAENGII